MKYIYKTIIIATVLIILISIGFLGANFLKNRYFQPITSENGRTNFLLLGINGNGGVDADLTDTIIFTSLDSNNKEALMVSIPRDIWIKDIQAKINTAYHYGKIEMSKKVVSDVIGQKINYMFVLNFDGFEKAVDFLGGVQVDVQNSFDDFKYPIPGKEKDLCNGDKELKCRYEQLHFERGLQLMDGKTALKYVRSRNAEGDEGTDFARAARQQQFLLALKQEVFSSKFYFHPKKIYRLVEIFQSSLVTDVKVNQYGSFLLLASKINWNLIKMTAINGNLLIHPKIHYSNQWVLIPKSGDFKEVHKFVEDL